jgi:hypothetical protein
VPARLTTDAGEAVVRIAAFDEAPDHLLFDRVSQPLPPIASPQAFSAASTSSSIFFASPKSMRLFSL